jgi:hypothetical protein
MAQARAVLAAWRQDYNTIRPHSKLGRLTPAEIAGQLSWGHAPIPSCGTRRMAASAAQLVDRVLPRVPVRQFVLMLPIPLRLLLAARPGLIAPVLGVVHRLLARHLAALAGLRGVI